MLNVEIKNTGDENNINLLRSFSKQVRSSGVIKKSKSLRYNNRKENKFLRKKHALRDIEKQEKREKLIKLGKVSDIRSGFKTKTLD